MFHIHVQLVGLNKYCGTGYIDLREKKNADINA